MLLEHLGNIIPVLLEMIRHNIVDISADTYFDALQCQKVYQFQDGLMRRLTDIHGLTRAKFLALLKGILIATASAPRLDLDRRTLILRNRGFGLCRR